MYISQTADLSVGDDGDPVGLGGSRHRQHGPDEHGDGVGEGQERGGHQVVQDHGEVTQQLRP